MKVKKPGTTIVPAGFPDIVDRRLLDAVPTLEREAFAAIE